MPDEEWSGESPSPSPDSPEPADASAANPDGSGSGSGGDSSTTPARHADHANRSQMGRTVGYTVLGTVLPGAGLIAARRRLVGGIVLGIFAVLVLGTTVWGFVDTESFISVAVNPNLLHGVAIGLLVLGAAWVAVVVVSHLAVRHTPMAKTQRVGASVLVGVLCFAVAAPTAIAARYSYDQAGLVSSVFRHANQSHSATRPGDSGHGGKHHGSGDSKHPWADKSRVNILLLGGDAGIDRTGNRTDTVMVASIDTKTGDTTLIGLPRNTARMPFPKGSPLHKYYPDGFTKGNGNDAEYFLNAMYQNVPKKVPKDALGKTDNLGADAMKISVGDAIGLKLDYYVLINLKGFRQLIDALGGITVNINEYVAIGGKSDEGIPPDSYLKPGKKKHLNGKKALWFARGRYGADDFQRMDRQRCVMNSIIDQAHPANVLARYEKIVKAGKKIVRTDIPQEDLSAFVTLSNRVKHGHVRSLVFKSGKKGFHSADPDFDLMRKQVKKSLGEAKKPPKKSKKASKSATPSESASSSPSPTASSSSQSRSTSDACAWDPEKAKKAQPPR